MEDRLNLVLEYLKGERTMASLCRKYGMSRKTAYKWVNRYRAQGLQGLKDRPRAPHRRPHALDPETVRLVVETRVLHPGWGPRRLRRHLLAQPGEAKVPAASTIGAILKKHGLTRPRRSIHPLSTETELDRAA